MLSDDMEKLDIIVGKRCMEISEVIMSLSNTYNLLTTDLSYEDSLCIYPASIQIVRLSADEMSQFVAFYTHNTSLQRIGFSESSLLYIAKSRKIKVAVMDRITRKICEELGICTIQIQYKKPEIQEPFIANKDSRISKTNIFRIAACL